MNAFAAVSVIGVALFCQPQTHAHACDDLNPEVKKALGYVIDDAYHIGSVSSEDNEELDWGRSAIVREGRQALPCLVEIARHGLRGTALWPGPTEAPSSARWAIDLVRAIDAPTAVGLLKEWRDEPNLDQLSRIRVGVELASLGEDGCLPDVTQFLTSPPPDSVTDPRSLRSVQERAIEVISIRNYRSALAALQYMHSDKGPDYAKHWRWLPVYIAQLSGDDATLLRYAEDPERFSWSLRAMKRMGNVDALKKLAADEKYRFRELAKTLLVAGSL